MSFVAESEEEVPDVFGPDGVGGGMEVLCEAGATVDVGVDGLGCEVAVGLSSIKRRRKSVMCGSFASERGWKWEPHSYCRTGAEKRYSPTVAPEQRAVRRGRG